MLTGSPPSSDLAVRAIHSQAQPPAPVSLKTAPPILPDHYIPTHGLTGFFSALEQALLSPACVCVHAVLASLVCVYYTSLTPPRPNWYPFLLQMPSKLETSSPSFVPLNEIHSYFYYSSFHSLSHVRITPICLPCGMLRLPTLLNSSL